MELVSTLEDAGDSDGALTELRQAVRFEPGHKEAWLLLVDRLIARYLRMALPHRLTRVRGARHGAARVEPALARALSATGPSPNSTA